MAQLDQDERKPLSKRKRRAEIQQAMDKPDDEDPEDDVASLLRKVGLPVKEYRDKIIGAAGGSSADTAKAAANGSETSAAGSGCSGGAKDKAPSAPASAAGAAGMAVSGAPKPASPPKVVAPKSPKPGAGAGACGRGEFGRRGELGRRGEPSGVAVPPTLVRGERSTVIECEGGISYSPGPG